MIQNCHPLVGQVRRAFQFLTEKHAHHDDLPLSSEFPVAAVDNVIVGKRGSLIASLPTPGKAGRCGAAAERRRVAAPGGALGTLGLGGYQPNPGRSNSWSKP
jgi:hypothetical protein